MSDSRSKSTARALDGTSGFRFVSKKPEVIRTLVVRERTRLPIFIIAITFTAAIVAAGWYFYESAQLSRERRISEEKFIAILESSQAAPPPVSALPPAKTSQSAPSPLGSQSKGAASALPASPAPQNSSDPNLRTPPTVRAATAEVDGRPVTR